MTVECAEIGDATAVAIVKDSILALGRRVEKAIELYGETPELICGGGLFNSIYFSSLLSAELEKYGVSIYIPEHSQIFGACVRAAKLVVGIDKGIFAENFRNTMPNSKN